MRLCRKCFDILSGCIQQGFRYDPGVLDDKCVACREVKSIFMTFDLEDIYMADLLHLVIRLSKKQ